MSHNNDDDDDDNGKKLDAIIDALFGPEENGPSDDYHRGDSRMYKTDLNKVSSVLKEEEEREQRRNRIIVPIEEYLGIVPKTFNRYFELEGGTFPDLYARYEDKTDDVDSKVQYVAATRGGKLYSNLLVMAVAERQKRVEKELQEKKHKAVKDLMDQMLKDFGGSGSFDGGGGGGEKKC